MVSSNKRKLIYLNAITKWTKSYDYDFGIIENSGYDFPELKDKNSDYYSPKVKIISFDYNNLSPQLKKILLETTSKGIHELISINYFLNNYNISKYSHIIKITGRYFIPNFDKLVIDNIKGNHLAITQNKPDRCEIVGCSTHIANYIFSLSIDFDHIEYEFLKRIYVIPKKNILKLPILPIKHTKRGCEGKPWCYALNSL